MTIARCGTRVNVGDVLADKGENLPSLTVTHAFHGGQGLIGTFLAQRGDGERWSVWVVDVFGNYSRTFETADPFAAIGSFQNRIIYLLDSARNSLSM